MEKILHKLNSFEFDRAIQTLDKLIELSLYAFVISSMFSISLTQISFAIGALTWLLKVHLTKTWGALRGTWVGIAILCFCLAYILSIITSVDPESSLKNMKKLLQFVIFFWVANSIQGEKLRAWLIKLIIIAGVATALYGLLPLINPSFFSPDMLYGQNRPIGTLGVPATFSAILMVAGLMALARLLFTSPKEYWIMGSIGAICICLLLTMTRQAWLGFFVGSLFLLFVSNKKYLLILPLLFAIILFFSPDTIKYRIYSLKNLSDAALQSRVSTWKGGWEIFKDHPITGCGHKCVDSIHHQYSDPSGWIAHHRGMHNNIFQLLVDTGVLGLGTWIIIWIAYYFEILKHWKVLAGDKFRGDGAGVLMGSSAAVLAFLIGGFFEASVYDSEVTMLLYFLMGISLTQVKKYKAE